MLRSASRRHSDFRFRFLHQSPNSSVDSLLASSVILSVVVPSVVVARATSSIPTRTFRLRASTFPLPGDFLPTSGTGSRVGRFRTGALFAGLSTSTVVRLPPRCAVTCSDYRRARGSSCRCPRQRRGSPVYRRADSRRSTLRLPVLREQLSATSRRLSHGADEQRVENDEDRARNELDEDHAEPVVDVEQQGDDLRTEL